MARVEMQSLVPVVEVDKKFRGLFPKIIHFNRLQSMVFRHLYHEDCSIALRAPAGSGKTVIFELAMVKVLTTTDLLGLNPNEFKIVYLASTKVVCEARFADWQHRFGPLSLRVMLINGDAAIAMDALRDVNLVIATPEMWEAVTRKWEESQHFIEHVSLVMLDEVHMLGDKTRGPVLEVVVNRMRWARHINGPIRFVAVSATIRKMADISSWLTQPQNPCRTFEFGDEVLPFNLRKVVIGYPCHVFPPDYRFDLRLNYKFIEYVQRYGRGKSTLIFCPTRKGVELAAKELGRTFSVPLSRSQLASLHRAAAMMHSDFCQHLMRLGIGCYHAGLHVDDRRILEQLFHDADLPILVASSSLALGMHVSAHVVIIKNTWRYNAGGVVPIDDIDIQQMMGRAGRAQMDSENVVVILTTATEKGRFDDLEECSHPIESSLFHALPEFLNSEICMRTISSMGAILDHIKTTFFYVRVRQNPSYYSIPVNLSCAQLDSHLNQRCLDAVNKLLQHGMIIHVENNMIANTPTGILMSEYAISLETFQRFRHVQGSESVPILLQMLCASKELKGIYLRQQEKGILNKVNSFRSLKYLRYGLSGKVSDDKMKANCLIQAKFGCIDLNEPSLEMDANELVRRGQKIVKCLAEYIKRLPDAYQATLSVLTLQKCFKTGLWENSTLIASQFNGVTIEDAKVLSEAGITKFTQIAAMHPTRIDMMLKKQLPIGKTLVEVAQKMPRYEVYLAEEETDTGNITVLVSLRLMNACSLAQSMGVPPDSTMTLLIGNVTLNTCMHLEEIKHLTMYCEPVWSKMFDLAVVKTKTIVSASFISLEWVGIDCHAELTIYPGKLVQPLKPGNAAGPLVSGRKEAKSKTRNQQQLQIDSYFKPSAAMAASTNPPICTAMGKPPIVMPIRTLPSLASLQNPITEQQQSKPPPIYEILQFGRRKPDQRPAQQPAELPPPAPLSNVEQTNQIQSNVRSCMTYDQQVQAGVRLPTINFDDLFGFEDAMPNGNMPWLNAANTGAAAPPLLPQAPPPLAPSPPTPVSKIRRIPDTIGPPFCLIHQFAHYGDCDNLLEPIDKPALDACEIGTGQLDVDDQGMASALELIDSMIADEWTHNVGAQGPIGNQDPLIGGYPNDENDDILNFANSRNPVPTIEQIDEIWNNISQGSTPDFLTSGTSPDLSCINDMSSDPTPENVPKRMTIAEQIEQSVKMFNESQSMQTTSQPNFPMPQAHDQMAQTESRKVYIFGHGTFKLPMAPMQPCAQNKRNISARTQPPRAFRKQRQMPVSGSNAARGRLFQTRAGQAVPNPPSTRPRAFSQSSPVFQPYVPSGYSVPRFVPPNEFVQKPHANDGEIAPNNSQVQSTQEKRYVHSKPIRIQNIDAIEDPYLHTSSGAQAQAASPHYPLQPVATELNANITAATTMQHMARGSNNNTAHTEQGKAGRQSRHRLYEDSQLLLEHQRGSTSSAPRWAGPKPDHRRSHSTDRRNDHSRGQSNETKEERRVSPIIIKRGLRSKHRRSSSLNAPQGPRAEQDQKRSHSAGECKGSSRIESKQAKIVSPIIIKRTLRSKQQNSSSSSAPPQARAKQDHACSHSAGGGKDSSQAQNLPSKQERVQPIIIKGQREVIQRSYPSKENTKTAHPEVDSYYEDTPGSSVSNQFGNEQIPISEDHKEVVYVYTGHCTEVTHDPRGAQVAQIYQVVQEEQVEPDAFQISDDDTLPINEACREEFRRKFSSCGSCLERVPKLVESRYGRGMKPDASTRVQDYLITSKHKMQRFMEALLVPPEQTTSETSPSQDISSETASSETAVNEATANNEENDESASEERTENELAPQEKKLKSNAPKKQENRKSKGKKTTKAKKKLAWRSPIAEFRESK